MWSEAETEILTQLEEELQGTKHINIAIAKILQSKIAKQISYKRKTLLSRTKIIKRYTPTLDPEPVPVPEPLTIPLVDAICVSGRENVDMSAELLTWAIEGKNVDDLQDKLLDIIKTACSKPIKTKSTQNGPAGPPQNPRSKKGKTGRV